MKADDDRSAMHSGGSQRLSTVMTGHADSALERRSAMFQLYLVKPEQVGPFWQAADPNAFARKLILDHIEAVSDSTDKDWRTWD